MGSDIKDIISFKELKEMVEPDVCKYVMDIYRDMQSYSFRIIEDFYRDYRPHYYKRLGQLPRIWQTPVITKTKDGYEIMFTYSSEGLSKHPSPHDYYVFNGPFEQGYHGGPKGKDEIGESWSPAPQMVPSPWISIRDYAINRYNAYEL